MRGWCAKSLDESLKWVVVVFVKSDLLHFLIRPTSYHLVLVHHLVLAPVLALVVISGSWSEIFKLVRGIVDRRDANPER
jgi:hypothetical protein